jgi:catechol 2,3-dioxygenase-like lactoylglutathione lyase family enzyme
VLVDKIAIVVDDYDQAIRFFTEALGFDLAEDSPALTTEGGRPKRWVVVRPPGAETGILLARADGERQAAAVGNQVAGRVGFFLQVEVFLDISGNRWDLIGPVASH